MKTGVLQAQTEAGNCPSDPSVYPSMTGTVRSPTAGIAFRNDVVVPDRKSDLSEFSEPSDLDENPNPWIKVVPRRTRSLHSLNKVGMNKNSITAKKNIKALRTEKETVFNRAEEQLTTAQKEHISRRYEKINEKPRKETEPSTSRGEGPSNPKGKSVDPRNWGAAQLSDEDIDVDTQCAALESFKKHRKETPTRLNSEVENPVQEQDTYNKKKRASKASKPNTQTPMSDLTG